MTVRQTEGKPDDDLFLYLSYDLFIFDENAIPMRIREILFDDYDLEY